MQLKSQLTFPKKRNLEESNDGERNKTYSLSYSHGETLNPINLSFDLNDVICF